MHVCGSVEGMCGGEVGCGECEGVCVGCVGCRGVWVGVGCMCQLCVWGGIWWCVVYREPQPGGAPRAHPNCKEHSFGWPSMLGFLPCVLFDF